MKCTYMGPQDGFLPGCANDNCGNVNGFDVAKDKCSKDELCSGILKIGPKQEIYQLRSGVKRMKSPTGETSWLKSCGMLLLSLIHS